MKPRRWVLGIIGGCILLVTIAVWWQPWASSSFTSADPFALTPVSTSSFLNTGPDARYIGSEACRACHEGRHTTFRSTGMGCSMGGIDLANEPPDATFDHPPSRRRYQVYRHEGRMWHRESLVVPGSADVILSDYPVSHVVGSGHHSRSYFVEAEGFLVESPITWYTSRKAWGMSPGYDEPNHPGFERAAGVGCLHCHAGRSEALGGSLHRMKITEAAIGCERCHGPGSLHAARHTATDQRTGTLDPTIVNPARLPRDLAEAVCQQCHLRTTATILARGHGFTDYRPGLPRQDFFHDYVLEIADRPMTVVGHVEQMHMSRCYQASQTLTCVTCHSPHAEPSPEKKIAHFQAACLGCHQQQQCKVNPDRRAKESPANDCVQCHMPRSPTEIPHLAFTHHRIGIHTAATDKPAPPGNATLRPFLDLSRFSDIDQKRSLGLGYLEAANREKRTGLAKQLRGRALELLTEVRTAGLPDPVVSANLARLRFDLGLGDIAPLAENALASPALDGQDRCTALLLLGDTQAHAGKHNEAIVTLRQLTDLRRHPVDWLFLARSENALGHTAAEMAALETAVKINPRLWDAQQRLADHFRKEGHAEKAAWHQRRVVR